MYYALSIKTHSSFLFGIRYTTVEQNEKLRRQSTRLSSLYRPKYYDITFLSTEKLSGKKKKERNTIIVNSTQ
jgi:hypothetical protein